METVQIGGEKRRKKIPTLHADKWLFSHSMFSNQSIFQTFYDSAKVFKSLWMHSNPVYTNIHHPPFYAYI